MSDRARIVYNQTVIDDQQMDGDITSATIIPLGRVNGLSMQGIVTESASPSGVLKLQGSNDGVNFADTDGCFEVDADTTEYLLNFTNPQFVFGRVVYTRTSGDGKLKVIVTGKVF